MPTNLQRDFAIVLKELRSKHQYSQEELAAKCGLHVTYISQLERSLKSPTLETLQKLAIALGVSMAEFLLLVELRSRHNNS